MLRILRIPSQFGNAAGRAAGKRRSRVQQPCLTPLEARTLLSSFQGIGANTNATAVSADGSVVVGSVIHGGPIYWTQSSGPVFLYDSSGSIYPPGGVATSVSGNGSVIVGGSFGYQPPGDRAFRWANGVAAPILQLASAEASSANSVSTDGTIIVGDVDGGGGLKSPYMLTGANLEIIPLPAGDYSGNDTIMSANGAVVAGNASVGGSPNELTWQWENGKLIQFPDGLHTGVGSGATAVSPDGSVVVGSIGAQAFEWTNGLVTTLTWPAGYNRGSATAVSTDGTTIVGYMLPQGGVGGPNRVPFIWTQASGVQNLQQVLISDDLGSSLTGWTLTAATAITPDGSTIVGNGIDRQGNTEGWIATLNILPPPPLRISVTPNGPSIAIGTTQQFTATGLFSDNSTENITSQVTWASATPSVATISATGLATALANGTSSITASLSGVTGATMLTVATRILQSITVTPASASIAVGATEQFFATGRFSDNSTENITSQVTWTSASTLVATISSAGLARAVAMGSSSITASLSGVSGEAMLTVTRTPPPLLFRTKTLLTATPRSATVGQTVTLTATVKATGPVSGSPSGIVTFMDNGTTLGMIRLSRGKAKLRTSRLYLGTNRIQVIYSGDNYFKGGKSTFLVETIVKRPKKAK